MCVCRCVCVRVYNVMHNESNGHSTKSTTLKKNPKASMFCCVRFFCQPHPAVCLSRFCKEIKFSITVCGWLKLHNHGDMQSSLEASYSNQIYLFQTIHLAFYQVSILCEKLKHTVFVYTRTHTDKHCMQAVMS